MLSSIYPRIYAKNVLFGSVRNSSKSGDPKFTRVSVKSFRFCTWSLREHSNKECSIWMSHGRWHLWHSTGCSGGRWQHRHASSFISARLWGRTLATDQMLDKRICGWICLKSSKSLDVSILAFHRDVSWLRTAVLHKRSLELTSVNRNKALLSLNYSLFGKSIKTVGLIKYLQVWLHSTYM